MEKNNVIRTKSYKFALDIIKLYKYLINEKKETVISKQLLRSGTSIGANVREADNAESKADFIHKMGIVQKECDESLYWIELLKEGGFLVNCDTIHNEAEEMLKLAKSIILTAKKNKE